MICPFCGGEMRGEPAADALVGLKDLAVVCREYGITPRELLGKNRQRHLVDARSALARKLKARGQGPVAIGRLLNRDHSTVINLLRRPA